MFGYITVNKPELKIKDFEKYRSYYCGLCHSLKDSYRLTGRLTLNYDMVFLIMVLTDLYDEREIVTEKRCVVHPLSKHQIRRSPVTDYCADMCVLLSYYKVLDDWNDDKKLKSRLAMGALKRKARRAAERYPDKAKLVKQRISMLNSVENSGEQIIDKVARLFGDIMAEIFVYKDDQYSRDLYRVGFFLGKFIYLLDAYEDVEEDMESGAYNPFKDMYGTMEQNEFNEAVLNLLMLMIGECTDSFERLPLIENTEVLRNILYSGVWGRFGIAKAKRQEKAEERDDAADAAGPGAEAIEQGENPALT